jgi:hypothetical protein
LFLLAGWRSNLEALIFGGVFTLAGMARYAFSTPATPAVYWVNLPALILPLIQQRLAKRWPERYRLPVEGHVSVVVVGSLSLWLLLSRWVMTFAGGFYLTASWSALALVLFLLGMGWRERVYRWTGLGILGAALGRVVIFDIWQLGMIYRVLSLAALGCVLLVLGYLYSRFQERIKQWL